MKQNELSDEVPGEGFRSDIDASHLLKTGARYKALKRVCRVTVEPQEHQKVLLGNFTADKAPKGYSVELVPDPYPKGSVTTQITCIGTPKRYRLIMYIANFGSKTVEAEVRQV